VAVEKLPFSQNSQKLGDRKCLGGRSKSLVELPDTFLIFADFSEASFSTATGIITSYLRMRRFSSAGAVTTIDAYPRTLN
jgi:hypothetical protein